VLARVLGHRILRMCRSARLPQAVIKDVEKAAVETARKGNL
jgi:hypothetical protein